MSFPSFSDFKSALELFGNDDQEKSLLFISYIILAVFLYFISSSLFSHFKLFNISFFIENSVFSKEVSNRIIVFAILLCFPFLYILLSLLWKNRFHFPFIFDNYFWDYKKGLAEWDFQGNVLLDEKKQAIHLVQSDLGMIIKNREWKNFSMNFEFKILSKPLFSQEDEEKNQFRRGFGIIYRAKQLGQYYMIKIDESGISPHVRNLYWENNGPLWKINFTKSDLDTWTQVKIKVVENILNISIKGNNHTFSLPTHSNAHRDKKYPYDDEMESRPFSPISFRNSGSVGFRSAPLEEVFIRKILIKKIQVIRLFGLKIV